MGAALLGVTLPGEFRVACGVVSPLAVRLLKNGSDSMPGEATRVYSATTPNAASASSELQSHLIAGRERSSSARPASFS
jgi:hypothetical protein